METETRQISASGKEWHVENIPHAHLTDLVTRCNLDDPKASGQVVENAPLTVKGWALSIEGKQSQLHLVLRFPSYTVSHPMNKDRRDVVENVLNVEADGHPQMRCGFHYSVPLDDALKGFEIGFEADGYIYTFAKVYVV